MISIGGPTKDTDWDELAETFGFGTARPKKAAQDSWRQWTRTKAGQEWVTEKNVVFAFKSEGKESISSETFTERPITPDQQAEFHQIDLEVFQAGDIDTNYWEVDMKVKRQIGVDENGKPIIVETPINRPLHQLKVHWVRKPLAIKDYTVLEEELRKSFIPKSFKPRIPEIGEFKTYVVIPDVHRPYHNKFLWDGLLEFIHRVKPAGLVILGDFVDLRSLSSHDHGSVVPMTLWEEYLDGKQGVMELAQAHDSAEKFFLAGNHEDRYYRYVNNLNMSKLGEAIVPIEIGLGLQEWEYLNNWKEDYVRLGNLQVIHGASTGASALKKHLTLANSVGMDLMYGHTHWWESMVDANHSVWNIGTLCDIDDVEGFGYLSRFGRLKWQNGFATVIVDDEDNHFVTPIKCTKRNFFVDGIKY